MSRPRRFVYSDRHPPAYISHPMTLVRKYGFVVIRDLHSILFQKYSVDSLIPSSNGSVLIVYILYFLNSATGNTIGYSAQNNHNFNLTITLSLIIALIKAIWYHTYFISLLVSSLHWHGFESRNWTIGRFVSSSRLLLNFECVVYHEYVCTFIDEPK